MRRFLASLFLAFGLVTRAAADPGYYVVTVYDDPGLKTVDLRYWSVRRNGGHAVLWPEVGLGWNVNGPWYTEVLVSGLAGRDVPTQVDTLNWQNDLLLTRGQYAFDLAVHSLLVRPQNPAQGWSLELGPVLQTEIGRTQFNGNLVFVRGFGAASEGATELTYQWQVRHHWKPWLHVGAQGFGELGPWNHWEKAHEQSHRAGPALFGRIEAGPGAFAWQAAWLFGKTYGRAGQMVTARLKYDF